MINILKCYVLIKQICIFSLSSFSFRLRHI